MMTGNLPRFARIAFAVHLVLALAFGLWLFLAPDSMGAVFKLDLDAKVMVVMRALGAMLLGLGGVTSSSCLFAKSWEQVVTVVYAEVVYLFLQLVIAVAALIMGEGTFLLNLLLILVSLGLLVMFVMAWVKRPRV